MPNVVLDSGPLRLSVNPRLGAGIAELSLRRPDGTHFPLLRPAPAGADYFNQLACYFLAPWANRIAGARLNWHHRSHTLTPDWPDGAAIHGLVKDRPWRIIDRSPVSISLEFASRAAPDLVFPWPFTCRARYELAAGSLTTDLRLLALPCDDSLGPMPAGLGFHPFFCRTLWDPADAVSIRCSLRGRYPTRAMIPTGPAAPDSITEHLASGRPLGSIALDDVFLGSPDNAMIHWPASGVRLTFSCSALLGHTVLYTGEPDAATGALPPFFCLEPVSMVNDGFNLHSRGMPGTGVAELKPGESISARWTMRIQTDAPPAAATLP